MTTIKLKNGSGAPTAGDLAQGEPALDLTNKRLYTEDSVGTVIEVGTNPTSITTGDITATGTAPFAGLATTADVSFGDNDKAVFGAGSDLQIYHDGSASYIKDLGTGPLAINTNGSEIMLTGQSGGEYMLRAIQDGAVELYHDAAKKLATTSTGIDVTGTVSADGLTVDVSSGGVTETAATFKNNGTGANTKARLDFFAASTRYAGISGGYGASAPQMSFDISGTDVLDINSTGIDVTGTVTADGLTVDGNPVINGTSPQLFLQTGASNYNWQIAAQENVSDAFEISSGSADANATNDTYTKRLVIQQSGDISFYEDTGTTAKLFWDASAESLGIGTSSPTYPLDVSGSAGDVVRFTGDANNSMRAYLGSGYQIFQCVNSGTTNQFGYVAGEFFAQTAGTERMRIDSSGNVGIGTDSPATTLTVEGSGANGIELNRNGADATQSARLFFDSSTSGYAVTNVAGALAFNSGATAGVSSGSERMRIDSSGNLLVGTTSTANIANATPNVVTDQSYGINDTANKVAFQVDRISFDSSNYYVLNASAIGVKLVNGATAWTTQSDETLKENITELTNVLSKVQNLRCVSYNLKSQNSDDVKLGFIAQDWQTDFSQVVNVDPCDGKLGMNYTETIPVLLKAIQEQTEIINDLRARVAQLEKTNGYMDYRKP